MNVTGSVLGNLFFVRKLGVDEAQRRGMAYAVELLDNEARTINKVFFNDEDAQVMFGSFVIPPPVVEAAKRQAEGSGAYINEHGAPAIPSSM